MVSAGVLHKRQGTPPPSSADHGHHQPYGTTRCVNISRLANLGLNLGLSRSTTRPPLLLHKCQKETITYCCRGERASIAINPRKRHCCCSIAHTALEKEARVEKEARGTPVVVRWAMYGAQSCLSKTEYNAVRLKANRDRGSRAETPHKTQREKHQTKTLPFFLLTRLRSRYLLLLPSALPRGN